jgi:hypothetical protein
LTETIGWSGDAVDAEAVLLFVQPAIAPAAAVASTIPVSDIQRLVMVLMDTPRCGEPGDDSSDADRDAH